MNENMLLKNLENMKIMDDVRILMDKRGRTMGRMMSEEGADDGGRGGRKGERSGVGSKQGLRSHKDNESTYINLQNVAQA